MSSYHMWYFRHPLDSLKNTLNLVTIRIVGFKLKITNFSRYMVCKIARFWQKNKRMVTVIVFMVFGGEVKGITKILYFMWKIIIFTVKLCWKKHFFYKRQTAGKKHFVRLYMVFLSSAGLLLRAAGIWLRLQYFYF